MGGHALYSVHDGAYVLKLTGDVRVPMCATLDRFIEGMFKDPSLKGVLIDLGDTEAIDSTALGLLAKIAIYYDRQFQAKPLLLSPNHDITKILLSMGFPQVFDLRTGVQNVGTQGPAGSSPAKSAPLSTPAPLSEVPSVGCSEQNACDKVLEAHRILMSMNDSNREAFKDVVQALEEVRQQKESDCDCAKAEQVVSRSLKP
ncbi:Anti-anti-sigma regulatory factor [gamma proteobacterium HdN1]|nr:Anti-anti-sigma regulatory factor [gamma proteobacterium HdN1]